MNELTALTRRNFLKALAASVLAAGVPLPVGLRREHLLFVDSYAAPNGNGRQWGTAFKTFLEATNYIAPGGKIFVRGTHYTKETLNFSSDPRQPIRIIGRGAKLGESLAGHVQITNCQLIAETE